jgi:four helix bundle protein
LRRRIQDSVIKTIMENFEKLNTWQSAKSLCLLCYKLAKKFPPEEKFVLGDQIRRSSVSVPSNIAEGYSRKSTKDLERFLEIACGSIYELITQVNIALELKFISKQEKEEVTNLAQSTIRLINGFKNFKHKE